ncbi:hypothetical protein BCR34DRAFT_82793 [Clohesyomyces aquaticus]|uniref:Uncharacterized protein n=1 Tax=Clohesyomyces aquaticus TaxID=1231657 RepID=A0A1Y1YXF1_9PLEO|nr:hypothetical protein BCR34DRAFT_82793 [Clohesyomyces aquaticus]
MNQRDLIGGLESLERTEHSLTVRQFSWERGKAVVDGGEVTWLWYSCPYQRKEVRKLGTRPEHSRERRHVPHLRNPLRYRGLRPTQCCSSKVLGSGNCPPWSSKMMERQESAAGLHKRIDNPRLHCLRLPDYYLNCLFQQTDSDSLLHMMMEKRGLVTSSRPWFWKSGEVERHYCY